MANHAPSPQALAGLPRGVGRPAHAVGLRGDLALGAGGEGEVFNLGTGDEWSVRDILGKITEILDVSPEIREDASRVRPERSEVLRLVSDNSRVRAKFGWSPKYSGLEGLQLGLESQVWMVSQVFGA